MDYVFVYCMTLREYTWTMYDSILPQIMSLNNTALHDWS